MAGFRKAKAMQAFDKRSVYGAPGSGKTFTTLLMAEGYAKLTGKRIAYIDTERGTDFYTQDVPARTIHPKAFDFDALYTRSITDILKEVKALNPNEHGVLVLDSITHVWEACIASYSGKKTRAGTIPMHAWGTIKKPYKDLMNFIINCPMHVFILGREGNMFEDEDGEVKAVGKKMKAEGETPYEPHICMQMQKHQPDGKGKRATVAAYVEKDRTGILDGKLIVEPTFATLCEPILHLFGTEQGQIEGADETARKDAEALSEASDAKASESAGLCRRWMARIELAESKDSLKAIGKELTPKEKERMTNEDLNSVRQAYRMKEGKLDRASETDEIAEFASSLG